MRHLRALLARLAGWQGRENRERDLQDEFESNLQLHIEDNLRSGMSPAEARRTALLRFGSVDSAAEQVRDRWTIAFLERTRQDVLYALRNLRRNPGFAATAIFSLALGTGAAIAIFTVADNLLLRPLPFHDPGRLVMVWEYNRRLANPNNVVAPANFRDWQSQNTVFEKLAVFAGGRGVLEAGGQVEELTIQFGSFDFLPLIGVKPIRGRLFTREEDLPNSPDVILISHRLWQARFSSDETVIGRKVQLRGRPATIIGVMPPGFYFRDRETDIWATVGLDPTRDYRKNGGRGLLCAARIKPGISFRAAQAEMTAIASRLEQAYPEFDRYWTVTLEPLRDSMVREVKTSIHVLLGAVGLLLAVSCANVANLLLARHTARRREMAVRAAIGAGRWRVVRQLVTESLVLGLVGGLLGLAAARPAVAALAGLAPRDLTRTAEIAIDFRVVLFALIISIATGLVFGLAPAFSMSRADLITGLREGARGIAGGYGLRNTLVAAEVALCLILLTGAGLLFRTLTGLQSVKPGLDPTRALTFRVSIPAAKYREDKQQIAFFQNALEQMRAIPGVGSASAINFLPFNGMAAGTGIAIAGRPPAAPGERLTATIRTVMPGYFQTIGIPIRQGRDFTDADMRPDTPYRFLVNETFVQRYLTGEKPLTKSVSARMQDTNPFGEIIGVVGDVKEGALDRDPRPTVYYNQGRMPSTSMVFVLRCTGDPLTLAEPARRIIHQLDPAQPIADVRPMQEVVDETFARQRFSAILLVGFSLVALLLASVGIYGVLAYSVTERTREIGVRMALGADTSRVIGMVLASGARVVLAGTVVGIAGAILLTGFMKTMLFGVNAHDTATFAVVPCVLIVVALVAAYVPARRASQVSPVDALRAD